MAQLLFRPRTCLTQSFKFMQQASPSLKKVYQSVPHISQTSLKCAHTQGCSASRTIRSHNLFPWRLKSDVSRCSSQYGILGLWPSGGTIARQNIRRFTTSRQIFSEKNGIQGKSQRKSLPPKSDMKRLITLAQPEKWKLIGATGLLLISSAVTMAMPFGIGRVIDIIYAKDEKGDMINKLTKFCQLLAGVFLIGAAANFGRVYLMTTSGNRIIKRLREMVFSTTIRQNMAFFDKNKTGELITRLSADAGIVGQTVTGNISDGLRSGVQAVGGIGMMVYMSPKLAAISLCIVPPLILMSKYYGKYLQNITKKVQTSLADSTQVAEERLSNMRTVQAFAQENKEVKAYSDKIEHVLQLSYKEALARSTFWSMTGLSGNIMILSVFYYGGLMMNEAQITVGELSSFMLYAAYAGISISGLTSFYSELMRGIGASSRLFELADIKSTIPLDVGVIPNLPLHGDIEFQGVDFSYPERTDQPILRSLDLVIPQGNVLAVVGASGSGKSTLAALLLRYYDPHRGCITVNGTDIRDFNPTWLRSNMGVVSQEPALFSCSIADNIAYGALDPSTVTAAQIEEAARMANAWSFIQDFPSRLDTLVGERGAMLSGGQKQRIAIARAILKNPKILLLDEATSALDSQSEFLVQEAMERVTVGRTVVTIAHRLSTIKHAHQIALLEGGRVAELGTYDQLISITDGRFRELVQHQTIQS